MKRSSCASGSRYVPACSTGFWVASTRKGTPTWRDDAVDRDLALLHDLQQRGLRLRARPVDLVRQDDVGEDGAGVELEGSGLLVVDGDAGDVAREQVGRELDAGVRALHGLRHGAGQRGLARARHVLEQDMAVAEHGGQDEFDDVALAQDGALDVVGDLGERLGEPGRLILSDAHVRLSFIGRSRVRGSRRGRGVVRFTGCRERAAEVAPAGKGPSPVHPSPPTR